MKPKELWWKVEDRYDDFMESPLETHGACIVGGIVIGIYLASLLWR